jgi:predicted transcriptional regulator YdeE
MDYEVVELPQKIVVGVSATTSNDDPNMSAVIGDLWMQLYGEGGVHERIKNTVNTFAIGLYSDYKDEHYTVTAGLEVSAAENPELTRKTIPAGRYAKFSVHGDMTAAVAKAWAQIWQMELDRSFTGDFEEYLNDDFKEADIDIYVALRS